MQNLQRFEDPVEEQFRLSRMAALAEINVSTFWLVAVLVMAFSWWDWYVDPRGWRNAFVIRGVGSIIILATGLTQLLAKRIDWAPLISKVRYTAGVVAVAGALAVLDRGFLVGIAGLVAVMLSAPYIAIDRRDVLVMNIAPMALTAAIMAAARLDRFAVVNSVIFMVLAVLVSLLLARVFESSNRRGFALEQELKREARTDALTGLPNRRSLEEAASMEVKRSARTGSPFAVVICDIDRFKSINDRFGHDAGDRVIKTVAENLRRVMRETDALGRWGGEEFLALLPDTDAAEAAVLAERMRKEVGDAWMPIPEAEFVTISLGVASLQATPEDPGQWERVVRDADHAMYRAKAAGRNRAEVAQAAPTSPAESVTG